jgi:hypothetical protein
MAFGPSGECTSSLTTFYSNCPALNVGCYLYYLVSGSYTPVPPGQYSNGAKCATVRGNPDDGYIESWTDCVTFWNLQFSYDCVNAVSSGSGPGNILAYGYFPDAPNFVPTGSYWYQEAFTGCSGDGELEVTGSCFVWNVIGLTPGPASSIDPNRDIIPLVAINFDQTGGAPTVCQGIQVTPTPTPTNTPSQTATPPNTPTPTATPEVQFDIDWTFTQGAVSGLFQIGVNGNTVISETTSGFGTITVNGGDSISIYTYGNASPPDSVDNSLQVIDNGSTLYNNTDSSSTTATNLYGPYTVTGDGTIIATNSSSL